MPSRASADRALGVVVVGTGWGSLTHVPALQHTGYDVKALVGTDLSRTQARARAANIPLATTSYAEALSLPGVDAVVIATPPRTHPELTLAAIAHGKHVLCEKPFATSVEDATWMWRAAEDAGVVHAVGQEMRWLPHQAALAMAVREGAIGRPTFATHLKLNGVLAGPTASAPDWFESQDGFGGWLNAEIQHIADEVRLSLGEFCTVSAAETSATEHGWDAPDSFVVQFELVSGVIGVIQSSIGTFGPPTSTLRVSGTEGTIWATPEGTVFRVLRGGSAEPVAPAAWLADGAELSAPPEVRGTSTLSRALAGATRFSRPAQHLVRAFRQHILGIEQAGWPPLPTFADGLANTVVHDAVRRSIASGRKCDVPPVTVG